MDGDTLILVKNWCKGISVSESGLTLDKNDGSKSEWVEVSKKARSG